MAKHKRIPDIRPHHHKPYRRRHLLALLAAFLLLVTAVIEIGMVIGRNQQLAVYGPQNTPNLSSEQNVTVKSNYGYVFGFKSNTFTAEGIIHEDTGKNRVATGAELHSENLVSVTVSPRPGAVSGSLATTQLRIAVSVEPSQVLPPPSSHNGLTVEKISQTVETLGGAAAQKAVYKFTTQQGGTSYSVSWNTIVNHRSIAVTLEGLINSPTIPLEYEALLRNLQLSANQAVLGATTFAAPVTLSKRGQLDTRYLSDALSPAVVQIFHTVCGVLTVEGQRLGESGCLTMTGSGFLVTANGYIATNGHVVVYSAKDAVANLLTTNEAVLQSYLRSLGLSGTQIAAAKSDAPTLAAHIAKIYDLPDSALKFSDKGEVWLVALGNDLPDIQRLSKLKSRMQLAAFQHETTTIKQAKVVGYDYSAKDAFTTISNPAYGFSSSDVAVLKVNVRAAPTIALQSGAVLRNEKIIVMGFPGDAGNAIIDNSQTDVTVTNGVVSAIRQAAGGRGKLYQSDADASHGNSGGPAIDEQGRVIGLLTYRYSDGGQGNAAKSYIRDINDFSNLARAYDIKLDSQSTTQANWQQGLQDYSHNHYSAALVSFKQVGTAYPAHRLVSSYIASSEQAIRDGKDVKDLPLGWLLGAGGGALLAIAWTLRLIIRHRAAHHLYRASQELSDNVPPQQLIQ